MQDWFSCLPHIGLLCEWSIRHYVSHKSRRSANDPIAGADEISIIAEMSRYQSLRNAVSTLASSAVNQVAWLDSLLGHLTSDGDASGYGNDELALELEDIFCAAADMIDFGELKPAEKEAIEPLEQLLTKWSGEENSNFWKRSALFEDVRWDEVRKVAQETLSALPDEPRAFGRFGQRPLPTSIAAKR